MAVPSVEAESLRELVRAREDLRGDLLRARSQRRLGPITKSGSQHTRQLLVEAAWHYRRRSGVSTNLRRRQHGADPRVVALSWKAQRRLHHVWQRMEQRKKRRTIITVAAARELAGFCWAIATAD